MIPLEEALSIIDMSLSEIAIKNETVSISQALGRIPAEDQYSRMNLPPFRRAMVDGYAISEQEPEEEYIEAGILPAGIMPQKEIKPGTAVRVMTGAPVPENAKRVIMVEHTEKVDEKVRILRSTPFTNIAEIGQDVKKGDPLMKKGERIEALHRASLMGCGISRVVCGKTVNMSIISTGDELVDSPEEAIEAKIININSPLLEGLCKKYSVNVIKSLTVPDDPLRLEEGIRESLKISDIVILSGGVSMGDFDFIPQILKKMKAQIRYHKVALLPGKPNLLATLGDKPIFGLPGNPLAVFVGFHLFVLRGVLLLSGGSPTIRKIKTRLATNFHRKATERLQLVPGRWNEKGRISPIRVGTSAHLASLNNADGFFLVPVGVQNLSTEEDVDFIPMNGFT